MGKVEQRQGLAVGGKSGEAIAKSMLERFPDGVKITSTASNRVNATVDRGVFYKVAAFLKEEMTATIDAACDHAIILWEKDPLSMRRALGTMRGSVV